MAGRQTNVTARTGSRFPVPGFSLQPSAFNLPTSPRAAFTLVELLAVICIIGILLGIVLGAAQFIVRTARENRYNSTGAALKVALETYRHEYNHWPIPSSITIVPGGSWTNTGPDNYTIFDMLHTENANDNPKGIRFLDYSGIFTLSSGARKTLYQALNDDGGTLKMAPAALHPIVYVTRSSKTAYYKVTFNFDLDTVSVSPPNPAVARDDQ